MKKIKALVVQKTQPDESGKIRARLRLSNKKLVTVYWLDNLNSDVKDSGNYFLEGSFIVANLQEDNRLTDVRTIQVTERLTDRIIYGEIEAKLKAIKTRKVIFK
jgi:hypothetical protein